jgi:AbiV family abortive infection protein
MNESQPQNLLPLTPRDAIGRAQAYLERANTLASTGDYPMAFAILVLGFEEWAKGVLLKIGMYEIAEWGTPDTVDPYRLDPKVLTSHTEKQQVAVLFAALTLPYRGRIFAVAKARSAGRDPTRAELDERFKKDVRIAKWLCRRFKSFEGMKQAAFYSGDRTAKGQPATVATKAQFDRLQPILAEQLPVDLWSLEHPLSCSMSGHVAG